MEGNCENDLSKKICKTKEEEKDSVGKITGFFLFRNVINNYNDLKGENEKRIKLIFFVNQRIFKAGFSSKFLIIFICI